MLLWLPSTSMAYTLMVRHFVHPVMRSRVNTSNKHVKLLLETICDDKVRPPCLQQGFCCMGFLFSITDNCPDWQANLADFLNVVFEVPEQAIGILVNVFKVWEWKPEGKHVTRHLFHVWSVVPFVFAVEDSVERLSTYICYNKYITCDFTRYLPVTLLPGEHKSHQASNLKLFRSLLNCWQHDVCNNP